MDISLLFQPRDLISSIAVNSLGDIASPYLTPLVFGNSRVSLHILILSLAAFYILVQVFTYSFSILWQVRASITVLGYMESNGFLKSLKASGMGILYSLVQLIVSKCV